MRSTAAREYLETQVVTASPERLHLMVVDGAIRFARQGEQALAAQNRELAMTALDRSRSCVNELLSGIVADPNPELAERLKALFLFVHRGLVRAELTNNPQLAREALSILEIHRETWLALIDRLQPPAVAQRDVPSAHAECQNSWTT